MCNLEWGLGDYLKYNHWQCLLESLFIFFMFIKIVGTAGLFGVREKSQTKSMRKKSSDPFQIEAISISKKACSSHYKLRKDCLPWILPVLLNEFVICSECSPLRREAWPSLCAPCSKSRSSSFESQSIWKWVQFGQPSRGLARANNSTSSPSSRDCKSFGANLGECHMTLFYQWSLPIWEFVCPLLPCVSSVLAHGSSLVLLLRYELSLQQSLFFQEGFAFLGQLPEVKKNLVDTWSSEQHNRGFSWQVSVKLDPCKIRFC